MSPQRDTDSEAADSADAHGRPPLYPGDDPRPTSKKELAGWYGYGWAAEVFPVCAMGMVPHQILQEIWLTRGQLHSSQ